jgi:subtilisin family serine protease
LKTTSFHKENLMAPKRSSLFVCVAVMVAVTVCLLLTSAGRTASVATSEKEKVLIRASKPYSSLVNKIRSLGGTVTQQYKYADAIAAEIPRDALGSLRNSVPAGAITKDLIVPAPQSVDTLRDRKGLTRTGDENQITAEDVQPLGDIDSPGAVRANAYTINNSIINASALHAGGTTGAGVIVAVIDTGIRPGFPHISLDGSVIGGEDFVGDGLGFSNSSNGGHGTFVAGMISANVTFTFSTASGFRNAVLAECPSCFSNPPTNTQIPMVGTAPSSSIYALRVFGPTGGAPESRIIAAMERAIELRELFDASLPGGRNIQVCNMSLGGSTLFAAQDLEDQVANVMLEKGIVLSVSAGNAGPSSITVASPGTSIGAITVGAASQPHNERILRRLQFGPVVGALYRPFLGVQTSYFSSRGPNADGRLDPDVTANGFANFGQGLSGGATTLNFASGTSFSSPSVAGVAALLRQKYPSATARQIRNAIIASANPSILSDGSSQLDQGTGYVDALAASNLLATGTVPDVLPSLFNSSKSVISNVTRGASLATYTDSVQQHFSNLKPGQRFEILYQVTANTGQVVIDLSNVLASLPPAQQNQLFGDDVLFSVHTAKTSAIGEGDYPVLTFTTGGTFVVNNPETGLMRITASGDWTNAGGISGDISISSSKDPLPRTTAKGNIVQGDSVVFPINIPAGISTADFRLVWREDWSNYPLSDIDMILVRPNLTLDFTGATLNDPERAVLTNPAAGQWLVIVDGFGIPAGKDKFELRVSLDGNVVKLN